MSDVDTSDEERRRNKRWPDALKREIVAATCRRHVQPDRHGKDEQHRPASLARRRPRPHRRASGISTRRVAALELATGKWGGQQGRLKSAGPAVLTACLHYNVSLAGCNEVSTSRLRSEPRLNG
jgi:hypothetical protein